MGELPKKKRKKAKKKSASKPRFALDVAKNPKPYEIPLYFPPFPSVINHQPKVAKEVFRVENLLRNYMGVNSRELQRLGNNMTAYRQEAQTAFHQNIAYPKASAIPSIPPPSTPEIPTTEDIISGTDIGGTDLTSSGEETLMGRAGAGAGRLTEPEGMTTTAGEESSVGRGAGGGGITSEYSPTDVSDFEGMTSGRESLKKVSFGDFMDLTSGGESDFAPRATKSQRQARRTRVYVDNAMNRRLGRVGKSY